MDTVSERTTKPPARSALRIDELPGPRRLPWIGNLLQLRLPRLHLQLEDWAKTYGNLYRLKLANQEVVVLSNPESIAGVMRARPDTWSRPRNFAGIVRETGGQGLFAAEGDDWRRQRRMVMTGFDPAHLRNYMPSLLRVTERLRQRWIRAARAGSTMDLQAELMRYSVDAASGLSFGVEINTLDDSRSELHEHMKPMFPTLFRRMNMPFPYWKYYRLASDVSHDEHLKDMHRIIGDLVAQGRERLRKHPERREQPTDLLEAMLAARDADGSALSEEAISGNVFTMLLASEDTTANTLAWTVYLLHRYPTAWQRLVAEADAELQGDAFARDIEQARSLRYAEACANEAMRLKPVAPLIFLDAIQETTIQGVRIPEGTRAFLLMRLGGTDESVVEEAGEFRPERWLAEGAESVHSPKRLSMPFGAGPRLCPGRYLAMLEINLVLGMLARNFDLLDVSTEDGTPPREAIEFTMHPVGLRMRLAERTQSNGILAPCSLGLFWS